jgi:hypothetical protein
MRLIFENVIICQRRSEKGKGEEGKGQTGMEQDSLVRLDPNGFFSLTPLLFPGGL